MYSQAPAVSGTVARTRGLGQMEVGDAVTDGGGLAPRKLVSGNPPRAHLRQYSINLRRRIFNCEIFHQRRYPPHLSLGRERRALGCRHFSR